MCTTNKKINSLLVFILVSFGNLSAMAQSEIFSLAAVPEAIKHKASVITHLENIDIKVESTDKLILNVHKIFTVVNEEGKNALLFNEYSSKNISLEEAEIKVYDAKGKTIERHKKKDMATVAVGEGLIEDGYVTYYNISTSSYPVTIEINYQQKLRSTLFIPDYRFISSEEGIVESNYTARVPADIGFRYKNINTSIKPEISQEGSYKVYKWRVKDLAPLEYEEGAVSGKTKYPHIAIAADNFSYYGFPGNLSSWKSFGAWLNNLYAGLDALSPERQQFFAKLVSDAPDNKEKVRRIYNYLQQNFRYVSIQLGIGGFKPFSAEFTDQKKYGDCKALSNYMKAALKSVGIKSYVAIINAEYNGAPVDPDFPSNKFNHVILCVPGQKDSIWLECTSNTNDFGKLGTFTENRNALLVTEEGGVLVPTPKSSSSANILSTVTRINMQNDLSAEMETIFKSEGEYKEMMADILKENKDKQKETLVYYLGFRQPDDFEFIKDESSPAFNTKLKMILGKMPEFNAGSKMFINPRIYKISQSKLPKSENRKLDFYFRFPFEKYDTTILKLPAEFTHDVLPADKELKCDYAFYKTKYWYNKEENSVYAATSFILKQHKIPAASYASVKTYFDNVLLDDAQRMVVKKGAAVTKDATPEKKAF
jgi:transglutaminase-like putative cysteine protease